MSSEKVRVCIRLVYGFFRGFRWGMVQSTLSNAQLEQERPGAPSHRTLRQRQKVHAARDLREVVGVKVAPTGVRASRSVILL